MKGASYNRRRLRIEEIRLLLLNESEINRRHVRAEFSQIWPVKINDKLTIFAIDYLRPEKLFPIRKKRLLTHL
jgi:hypothetical protein